MQCPAFFPSLGAVSAGNDARIRRTHWIHGQDYAYLKAKKRPSVHWKQSRPVISSSMGGKDRWDRLGKDEFDNLIAEEKLPLCFVGMSNCGKSHWSENLRTMKGFDRVCIDDEIEEAIRPELESMGYEGIDGMAEWMGYPSDDRFAANEKRYLELEEQITSRTLPSGSSNFVLDTTGSVVYLSPKTLRQLRSTYLIVHLAVSVDLLEEMKTSFFETPKPVVWGASYSSRPSETPIDSLKRCYDGLLHERFKRYSRLAHIAVPASVTRSSDTDMAKFLDIVRAQLRTHAYISQV